jgi:hypothetical protein
MRSRCTREASIRRGLKRASCRPMELRSTRGYWYSVDARVQQGGWQVLDAGGRVVESDPATKTYAMNFAVIHQDGRWIVRESENTRE